VIVYLDDVQGLQDVNRELARIVNDPWQCRTANPLFLNVTTIASLRGAVLSDAPFFKASSTNKNKCIELRLK